MRGELQSKADVVSYDESHPPVVVIKLPSRVLTDAEFEEVNRWLLDRPSRGAVGYVLDGRAAPEPDARRRREIGELLDALQERYGDAYLGTAIALSSAPGRAVFKALLWLRRGKSPLVAVATPEEGIATLRRLQQQPRR